MPYNSEGYEMADLSLKLLKAKFGQATAYAMMTGYLIASVSKSDAKRILEIVKEKVDKDE
jgi:hypothetical protein